MRIRSFLSALFFTSIIMLPSVLSPLAATLKQTKATNITHTISAATGQPQSDLPSPSWWSGVCDANNYANASTNPNHIPANTLPLNAAVPTNYRGVVACGPRPTPPPNGDGGPDVTVNFFNGAYPVLEWECVELSMRFMYLAYGINPYSADGKDVVNNYTTYNNNSILQPISNPTLGMEPQPGDILSYAGTKNFLSGHTSVVMSTNYPSPGNGKIKVLEENFSSNGTQTLSMTNWTIGSGVTGWLHHTIDLIPQSAPPTKKITINGTDFGPNETVTIRFDYTTLLGTITTTGTGTFSTAITIPASAQPGTHTFQFTGETSGFSPQTVFYVQSGWPMFGYNALHTHFNTTESVLNPTNVSGLTLDWSYTTGSYIYSSSPTIVNGIVYVGSWDHKLYALDANTGAFKWSYTTGNDIYSSPAVVNGVVYFGSLDQRIYAVDAMTGNLKWSYATGNFIESSPTVANGLVYIGSDDNKLYALDALTGTLRWSYTTSGIVDSSPAVANGIVYIGSGDNKLYALDALTGAFKWSYSTGGGIYYSSAVVNGVVYFSSDDGNLYALNAKTGVPIWKYYNVYTFSSSPAVANSIIYIGSSVDDKLYALDTVTRTVKWTYLTGVISYSSPAVANGVVYIGSDTGNALYALNATTGAFLWKYYAGGSILSSPSVVNGIVYVGADDYNLYAFHLPT